MKINRLLKNTLIIIITGLIVKIIGMIGKIITTRILGIEGMSKYALSYPTLLLFINISGFSMNNTMSKLVSEAIASKQYSPKLLLKKGIKTTFLISSICIIIYLCSINFISKNLLKDNELIMPLLMGTFLIPLVGISDALRGYLNGIKAVKFSSTSLFLEQLTRTIFSLLGIYIGLKINIIIATSFLYLALSIGEIASIIFCLIYIKKHKLIHYQNTQGEQKIIYKTASYLTLSRIIGSISYFLEPILYTNILIYLNYSKEIIHNTYTTTDIYIVPLLTIISFIPFSLSTAIIPHISEAYAKNNTKSLNYYLNKAYIFTLFPAIICLLSIHFYSSEFMNLLFKTTIGSTLAKKVSLLFIFYYLQIISSSILQAIGQVKIILINSFLSNLSRLALILVLPFFPTININSILYAVVISIIISATYLIINVFNKTKFNIYINEFISLTFLVIISYFAFELFIYFKLNFIISLLIVLIFNGLGFIKLFKKNYNGN
ncbi:MAG: oligosaccharide flippase family protein [Bacilli bacterium]|nr:oligosaccharide flippase family protein [Bacilli bacterium]